MKKNENYKAEKDRFFNLMADLIVKYKDKIEFDDDNNSEEVVTFRVITSSFFDVLRIVNYNNIEYNIHIKVWTNNT